MTLKPNKQTARPRVRRGRPRSAGKPGPLGFEMVRGGAVEAARNKIAVYLGNSSNARAVRYALAQAAERMPSDGIPANPTQDGPTYIQWSELEIDTGVEADLAMLKAKLAKVLPLHVVSNRYTYEVALLWTADNLPEVNNG